MSQLLAAAGEEDERLFVVESPLSQMIDETIALHEYVAFADQVMVDEGQRAFFEAVKLSHAQALARIEQSEFATLGDDECEGRNALA